MRIRSIARALQREYGSRSWRPGEEILAQLVQTMLSQNTTDANSLRAFHSLRARFPTWPQVDQASLGQVTAAIRSGGLARIKARRIKQILRQIGRQHPGYDLSFLRRWPTAKIQQYLGHFPGVGDKTAACVLLFALGRPVMPVDTHVLRVGRRLGLIEPQADAAKAHRLLQAAIPAALVFSLHLNLIQHGRSVCRARRPLCERCRLSGLCPSYPTLRFSQKS